jgi:hypothetical protein
MPDSPILAVPTGAPEQAIAYILARSHGAYTDLDVDTIVRAYWAQCVHVGVDPVLVVAQLIHETGNLTSWWAQRPHTSISSPSSETPSAPPRRLWAAVD